MLSLLKCVFTLRHEKARVKICVLCLIPGVAACLHVTLVNLVSPDLLDCHALGQQEVQTGLDSQL